VSGISGKASDLEEDEAAVEATTNESSKRALVEVLGVERRDRILAALYLVRQDGVVVVRQSSIQIWKALVNNTPRTGIYIFFPQVIIDLIDSPVREILPELVRQILYLISSDDFEQQEVSLRLSTLFIILTLILRPLGEPLENYVASSAIESSERS
jgi:hypothetical protein